jgi:hypothetical protein
MNVVVVTTKDELYHKHLCVEITRRHNVVAVLHPLWARKGRRAVREERRLQVRKFGRLHYLLRKLARNRVKSFGWDEAADLAAAQRRFFPDAAEAYRETVAPIAHDVEDINSPEGVGLLRGFRPDVVVCSGGPIYRGPLIRAANLMLNYHTGVSPLYNGAFTVYWTYANRQPHLTGGTLMKMSPVVDGGDILAHYLPEVAPGDTPATQFMKCIAGGISLYNRFLDDLSRGRPFVSVPQGRPFLNYYGHDWTVNQTLAISRYIKSDICKKFRRPEVVKEYWHLRDAAEAREAVRQTLTSLVCDV